VTGARSTYRFGPLERRGLFGAVRAGQAGLLAGGAVLAIATLDQAPTATGALLATLLFVASLVLALAPVGRRTAGDWAPVIFLFAIRSLVGTRKYRSSTPARGMLARRIPSARGRSEPEPLAADAPRSVRSVRIVEAAYHDRPLGVISEHSGRRLTAVLACQVSSFSLLDPEVQEQRLARWALVLAGAAGTPLRRLQWIERTAPAQGDQLARWLHSERDPAVPLRGTPMIDSYLELIGTTARVTQEHEVLLAVQIDVRRVRDRGKDGPPRALLEQTERIAQGLQAAEVTVLGALSAGQLARAVRTAFDPYCRSELAALETADADRDGLAEANAWPLGVQEAWDHYRTDGAVHATYWIGAWPRVDVSPMFMDALLGRSSAVRTVAVTFEPVAPERSTREVEAAVTRDRADRELRHRFGQSETARQRQAQDATIRREAELAEGHGEVRLAGFVTVSGRDHDDLRRACSEVHEHAARARLELHRMYGQQADAFTFTLPLGRGLR
jgi:Putative type VII ESX secretion system translocon, EccE